MTNINLNKHLLVKAHAKMWATIKEQQERGKAQQIQTKNERS